MSQVGRMVEIKRFPIAAIGEISRLEQKINRSISNSSLNDSTDRDEAARIVKVLAAFFCF
jgi:hypothetical protein